MKIIVTGADGFVGKALVKELLFQENEVIAVVRKKNESRLRETNNLRIVECDFCAYSQLANRIKKADVFFHFAWQGTSGESRKNYDVQMENVDITKLAVNQAKQCQCKTFVYAGSIMEYEAMALIGADNTFPAEGYIYSTAKLAADYIAKITTQNLGMKYINTVISNIYGIGEISSRFLNVLVKKLVDSSDIDLTEGKQLYDFIYIEDAVKAIVLAGCYGYKKTYYYIGNIKQHPLNEYIDSAKAIVASKSKLNYGAVKFDGPFLSYKEFDTKSLYDEFGFLPKITFEEGIKLLKKDVLK